MSQCRSRPRQTLSRERSLSESPLASFRCAHWATVPCKNQTAFSLRKEPLWRKSIRPSAPRLRCHWHNPNTASNPHVYREFQKFKTTQKEDTMTQAIATQRSTEQADALSLPTLWSRLYSGPGLPYWRSSSMGPPRPSGLAVLRPFCTKTQSAASLRLGLAYLLFDGKLATGAPWHRHGAI